MSHIVRIDLTIDDLDALGVAAGRLGFRLERDVSTFKWFGHVVGDYPLPEGLTAKDMGKCSHKLVRKDGTEDSYEIGLVRLEDGTYRPVFDFWGPGHTISAMCGGNSLPKLKDEYAYAVAESYWLQEGYETKRELAADGSLTLVAFQ